MKLQKAKNNAYSLLRSRPRSEAEMRSRLKLKGYGQEIVDTVVESLRKVGEIDDEKFARLWVDSKMQTNPVGDIALRRDLKGKGVAESIIEMVLGEKAQNYDDYSVALNMARERFKQLAKIDKRKALKRLYDYLSRRGFSYDIVNRVLDTVMNEG